MTTYTHEFYKDRDQATRYAAETILGLVLKQIPPVTSAIDIGCGVGTWLSVLQEHGATNVKGCDGPWVDQPLLQIDHQDFETVELHTAFPRLYVRYDIAISLEVAEHLPEERAADFVKFLTDLSDTVLFSAAIPGQGGTGHINEQWPSYWAELFKRHGYGTIDAIRGQVWDNMKFPVWYRQNTLLFVKGVPQVMPLALVHPELYLAHAKPGVKGSFKTLCGSIKHYVGA